MTEPMTIVIPMAGRGSRFAVAGYKDPKPLIPVKGVPMIRLVIENLRPSRPHRFVFICQRDHVADYKLAELLPTWAPGCAIVELDGITEGAACTVLAAADEISDAPLMIANSDQYVDVAIDDYLAVQDQGYDGLIMTMTAHDPKWSFVGLNAEGLVTTVVEKQVISDEATVGIYNFARGHDFLRGARRMIADGKRVNGEFYVAPVYNEIIAEGARIAISNVGTDTAGMYGLGIPADLEYFVSQPVAARATAAIR
ncbi:glycosyltransferase family 2 protein [Methylobacterium sp. J-068]|uniref:glycosyltransferase family 2 protein n=1 Tax=Methylobacterium sp. J-068 TaxID=2836649 RepID=UPI001FBAF5AA|nr:glycosyltransferase family 2 protein [Methylobacterium sp. J-068]MCJ2033221.1 glycosyltransferase family 2 protein [Methylobacterium sp. J-068]